MHSWQNMKGEVAQVRPYLAECFDNFFESLPEDKRDNLKVTAVNYKYGDKIIKDGKPFWQDSKEVPDDYLIGSVLPFGIILENYCEALEYTIGVKKIAQIPQTIFQEGEALGSVETLDFLTNSIALRVPDWTISAGASSIHFIPNLSTMENTRKLESALDQRIDDLAIEEKQTHLGQLRSLDIFNDIRNNWNVRILYFSKKWFELLKAQSHPNVASEPARNLTLELMIRSWRKQAKTRRGTDLLHDLLFEAATHRKPSHARLISITDKFLRKAYDVLGGRRPCYIPIKEDNKLGPFATISGEILQHVTEHDVVLCPGYLARKRDTGYLKLEHINPAIVDTNGQGAITKKVEKIVSIFRQSLRKNLSSDDLPPVLQKNADMFRHITFRTPASGPSPSVGQNVFQIDFTENYLNLTPQQMSEEQFFEPCFNDPLPNERCQFFMSAVRFER